MKINVTISKINQQINQIVPITYSFQSEHAHFNTVAAINCFLHYDLNEWNTFLPFRSMSTTVKVQ